VILAVIFFIFSGKDNEEEVASVDEGHRLILVKMQMQKLTVC
jgi:hypothetical protein